MPVRGELIAWSRILHQQEVLVALNTHGTDMRGADVTVDASLHPSGSTMKVLYRSDWTDAQLKAPPDDENKEVLPIRGRSAVRINLPPAGMVILG